jgi:ABC-type sugar transport system ATPase subunit
VPPRLRVVVLSDFPEEQLRTECQGLQELESFLESRLLLREGRVVGLQGSVGGGEVFDGLFELVELVEE